MGILSKDIAISFIKNQIKEPFAGIIDGFVDAMDSFVQVSDIGISFDGAGLMEFDKDKFNDAINDNFSDVLELLGATKSGNSDSNIVKFYSASDKYTVAGTYDVRVVMDSSNEIASVETRLSGESQWHAGTWTTAGLLTANSTIDEDTSEPLYPEHSLLLSIDLANTEQGEIYEVEVHVKQGVAGALEDLLDEVLEVDGRLDTSKGILDDRVLVMTRRIENEENRLNDAETRLIAKYARLERVLTMMQQQMGIVSTMSFGSGMY